MATPGRAVSLNTDTNFLKIIAMVTMLVDHAGKMFFPQYPWLRIIGRIAFPIYAYCIAAGTVYTRNVAKYALRVLLLALISQPIYVLALNHVTPAMRALEGQLNLLNMLRWYALSLNEANILFTLLVGILLIWSIREKKFIVTGALTLATYLLSSYINYGYLGVLLILIFYAFLDRPLASFVWVVGFMAWWGISGGGSYQLLGVRFALQTFALLAIPFIYLPTKTNLSLPKWVFYLFYPAHLAAIWGVTQLLKA